MRKIALLSFVLLIAACGDKVPESEAAKRVGAAPKQAVERAADKTKEALQKGADRTREADQKQ